MATGRDLGAQLLRRAADDEAAAAALLDVDGVSESIVGFHAQQAVEKALKAVLATSGIEFPFTHNVGLLVALCERAGMAPPSELADVDQLTPYAVQLRYGEEAPGTVVRATAQRWARIAVEWAREQTGT